MSIDSGFPSLGDDDAFSRAANPDRQFVEIRPLLAAEVVAVLDAECQAESRRTGVRIDRTQLLKRIVSQWAADRHGAAMMILRAAGTNPLEVD
jgi:hypothetical protein